MRKIIQITAVPAGSCEDTLKNSETLYALCDDGSVFYMNMELTLEWWNLPPIPQEDDPLPRDITP